MMHAILRLKLRLLARAYIRRYRPTIIAITGNVGKTTTKEAIAAVMSTKYSVRATGGNLNNELGIPLTILGDYADEYYRTGGTMNFWLRVLWRALRELLMTRRGYPQVLVLEFGADRPGDIRRLTHEYQPHVAVVTHVGDVPVHVEYFASPHELAQEKGRLVEGLASGDLAVLGSDDRLVLNMRSRTKGRVRTFGLREDADVRVTNIRPRLDGARVLGLSFDIALDGHTMPVVVLGALGGGVARACAAAVAVGDSMGIGLAASVEAFAHMSPPAGRMRVVEGIRDTIIIDDTYNASPAAMQSALDAVQALPAQRYFLILGDMRELGAYSEQAHQILGTRAAQVADILLCVGDSASIIAEAATSAMPSEHIHRARDSYEAATMAQQLLRSGDVILVKGSQGVRMERIVQEIMARPEQASRLLVRQSTRWLEK